MKRIERLRRAFTDSDFVPHSTCSIEGWGLAVAAGVAAGSIGGALISSNASSNAASAQEQSDANATQLQQQEFNTVQGEYAPQRNLGYGADSLLAQLYGIPNPNAAATTSYYSGGAAGGGAGNATPASAPGPAGTPNYSGFYNSPGYQFTLQQGQQAINRQASANGNLYSTNTLAQLNNYSQGQASTQYNNYVQQLMGMAGLGGQATAGTASAATTTSAFNSGLTGLSSLGGNLLSNSNVQNYLGGYTQSAYGAGANQLNTVTPFTD
jgi:hypothetical protein